MIIIQALWFFLPAGIANMTPSLLKKWEFLSGPMDFGRSVNGIRIFGDHKTIRGFVIAPITGVIVFWIQQQLYSFSWAQSISLFDYSSKTLWLGFLLGLGAIAGDAVKSFFKRRRTIAPGKPWIPFDQIDYTIGALIAIQWIYVPPISIMVTMVLLGLALHPLFNMLGYLLHIQKNKL